jgi:hypothetical protein
MYQISFALSIQFEIQVIKPLRLFFMLIPKCAGKQILEAQQA